MRRRQRAAVLIVALTALGVATLLVLAMLRTIAAGRSELRTETWRIQAAWLAESALDRARARLVDEPDYTGETWVVPAEELGSLDSGRVRIRAESVAGQPARRTIRVEADYPDQPHHRVRENREAVVELAGR
jgi:type II secretory pathway component PulK